MEILFSNHSKNRILERGISKKEVEGALLDPLKVIIKGEVNVAMRMRANGHLLIVIFADNISAYNIITVIDTSKVNKYL